MAIFRRAEGPVPFRGLFSAERVLFNIKGNEYRLVVAINYAFQVVMVKWLGTHKEYDEIDVEEVRYDVAGMQIRPIRTEQDHRAAVGRIEGLMGAAPGTPEGDELDVLATLVEAYEAKHHAMDAPDPVSAISVPDGATAAQPQGPGTADRQPRPVSEVLTGKRPLTLEMVRRVKAGLGISADLLVQVAPALGEVRSGSRKRPAKIDAKARAAAKKAAVHG